MPMFARRNQPSRVHTTLAHDQYLRHASFDKHIHSCCASHPHLCFAHLPLQSVGCSFQRYVSQNLVSTSESLIVCPRLALSCLFRNSLLSFRLICLQDTKENNVLSLAFQQARPFRGRFRPFVPDPQVEPGTQRTTYGRGQDLRLLRARPASARQGPNFQAER